MWFNKVIAEIKRCNFVYLTVYLYCLIDQMNVFCFSLREISREIYGKVKDDFLVISC